MKEKIEAAWEMGISYDEYRLLIEKYVEARKTSGLVQSDAMIQYTKLNASRMKRWDKVFTPTDESIEVFKAINQPELWLVITETWCGDAAHNLPIMAKVAALNPLISLRLVFRDEQPELMNLFLTNGSKSIPKFIRLTSQFEVLGAWGPRPAVLQQKVLQYKQKPDKPYEVHSMEIQAWYNANKGLAAEGEMRELIFANVVN